MTRNEKIAGGVGVLILLFLLFKKKVQAYVSAKLIDPVTKLSIGYAGVRNDPLVAGQAIVPPNVPNNINNSVFLTYLANMDTNLMCPDGYEPIIDPETGGVYCIMSGHGLTPDAAMDAIAYDPSRQRNSYGNISLKGNL